MISLRAFLAGCWWSHGVMLRERRGRAYALVCERCGASVTFPKQKPRYRRLKETSKVPAKVIQAEGRFQ